MFMELAWVAGRPLTKWNGETPTLQESGRGKVPSAAEKQCTYRGAEARGVGRLVAKHPVHRGGDSGQEGGPAGDAISSGTREQCKHFRDVLRAPVDRPAP